MKNQVFQTGNTFDSQEFKVGHAKKVWRRIYEQLPGTGVVKNVADFLSDGKVRSGMAIVKDTTPGADAQDYKALKWSEIVSAASGAGIDSLGIIGFLQEDIPVTSASTVGTCTVIVKGEIYGYMLGNTPQVAAAVSAAVKGMTQKNGLQIRVVD